MGKNQILNILMIYKNFLIQCISNQKQQNKSNRIRTLWKSSEISRNSADNKTQS